MAGTAGRKLFVGSLPSDISDPALRAEFGRYGQIEDIFVKPDCPPGKQWAFITFATPDQAQQAKEATDRTLHFQGAERPCDVMVAKNQGMYGQEPIGKGGYQAPSYDPGYSQSWGGKGGYGTPSHEQPGQKKIFVGSLPEAITETELRAEFSRYGQIDDLFINTKPVEPGRQWAFITFNTPEQAGNAKVSADRVLTFPGADKACEVTLARHQGMYGKGDHGGSDHGGHHGSHHAPAWSAPPRQEGPRKIFVGSLPQSITDATLGSEFSKYGQVVDVFINSKPCEPGRNWAFVTFAAGEQAQQAKDATDRILTFPGADKACEVMLAKNQGKFGQDPGGGGGGGGPPSGKGMYVPPPGGYGGGGGGGHQPPPPPTPPPPSLTPWRMYKTAAGLPYYHNNSTGVTTWECPPDLQVPEPGSRHAGPHVVAPTKGKGYYSPY